MSRLIYFILFFFFIFCGCNQTKTIDNKNLKLSFTISPEDGNWYYIEWEDTLGLSEGYISDSMSFIKRPKEVWCIVTSLSNDTLGYYKGLSTAQTFTYFQSIDSIVNLNFMIGLNFFSDRLDNATSKECYKNLLNKPISFKPVTVNLNQDLYNQEEVILERDFTTQ